MGIQNALTHASAQAYWQRHYGQRHSRKRTVAHRSKVYTHVSIARASSVSIPPAYPAVIQVSQRGRKQEGEMRGERRDDEIEREVVGDKWERCCRRREARRQKESRLAEKEESLTQPMVMRFIISLHQRNAGDDDASTSNSTLLGLSLFSPTIMIIVPHHTLIPRTLSLPTLTFTISELIPSGLRQRPFFELLPE